MGLFGEIRKRSRVRLCSDTYSLTVSGKFQGLVAAAQERIVQDRFVLIVSHFPSTFFQLQDELDQAGVTYELVAETPTAESLAEWYDESHQGVLRLALAPLLQVNGELDLPRRRQLSSMIVAERHPLPIYDRRLLEFARHLDAPVRLGYFVALQDPAVAPFLGEWTEMVLRQMGLRDHELVTSHLVSRRLESSYRKVERQLGQEQPADSPEEWLRLNAPWLAAIRSATGSRRSEEQA